MPRVLSRSWYSVEHTGPKVSAYGNALSGSGKPAHEVLICKHRFEMPPAFYLGRVEADSNFETLYVRGPGDAGGTDAADTATLYKHMLATVGRLS